MSEKAKPVGKIEIFPVSAAIWQNGAFFNVTIERAYKDDQEQWQSTQSFGREDLLKLAKVADHAHSWIMRAEEKARKEAVQND